MKLKSLWLENDGLRENLKESDDYWSKNPEYRNSGLDPNNPSWPTSLIPYLDLDCQSFASVEPSCIFSPRESDPFGPQFVITYITSLTSFSRTWSLYHWSSPILSTILAILIDPYYSHHNPSGTYLDSVDPNRALLESRAHLPPTWTLKGENRIATGHSHFILLFTWSNALLELNYNRYNFHSKGGTPGGIAWNWIAPSMAGRTGHLSLTYTIAQRSVFLLDEDEGQGKWYELSDVIGIWAKSGRFPVKTAIPSPMKEDLCVSWLPQLLQKVRVTEEERLSSNAVRNYMEIDPSRSILIIQKLSVTSVKRINLSQESLTLVKEVCPWSTHGQTRLISDPPSIRCYMCAYMCCGDVH